MNVTRWVGIPSRVVSVSVLRRLRSSTSWLPVRNFVVGGITIIAFWLTVSPTGSVARAFQLGLASVAMLGVVCCVRFPISGVVASALGTAAAWISGVTFDPFVMTGIAVFTAAERRASRVFPRVLVVSVLILFVVSLTYGVDGFEDRVRAGLLSAGVLVAAWVLGARTRQVGLEASARSRAEERLRLSRDVHDVLSHTLGSIGVRAGVAAHLDEPRGGALRETLRDIEKSARGGMQELQALLRKERGLEPAEGGKESPWSLRSAITDLAITMERSGIEAEVSFSGGVDELPAAAGTTIHRIVQEATTNAIRHASASFVSIAVSELNGRAVARISDDGSGRSDALNEGNGIRGMRERASLVGGDITIGTQKGGGLMVLLELPPLGEERK